MSSGGTRVSIDVMWPPAEATESVSTRGAGSPRSGIVFERDTNVEPFPYTPRLSSARGSARRRCLAGFDRRHDARLLGRRMPDLDMVTTGGPLRVFTLLHDARPVLLNLAEPASFDITHGQIGFR